MYNRDMYIMIPSLPHRKATVNVTAESIPFLTVAQKCPHQPPHKTLIPTPRLPLHPSQSLPLPSPQNHNHLFLRLPRFLTAASVAPGPSPGSGQYVDHLEN